MREKGKLYGISMGPGDPELITRRAWALLQRSDAHWTYPVRGREHASFALSIAKAAGLDPPPGAEALVFPMTHDKAKLAGAWSVAAQRVLEVLHRGSDVLFLVEGDASTYSSFGYLLDEHDTLVLLKVKPLLDDIIDLLDQRRLLEHSAFIERAGTPEERVVRDIRSLRGEQVNYLSLLLVKNPYRERDPIIRGCAKKPGRLREIRTNAG